MASFKLDNFSIMGAVTLTSVMTVMMLVMMRVSKAKYMEGDLISGDNWEFIARFCFLSLNGKFEYDIEYPEVTR